ncbi:nitrate reductase cytochrome c-type subunit; periplasmic nitrate reductase electron transfer subunit [Shewanella sp. WXL01]|uniref:Periplasmic nitrate reductase, electron transfer subunit n=1 Tax=Shewanella maritima TaxID=2520507 RepID=A0A411PG50_9GAMM|nr:MULTISPECIES: nitrate reductase cytochrome c-type subunit [Shewanella]NKF49293.1 nitrate reductase cytochrome c-type subunit; periplasmic nitrate reductase electron transfer subunit [Shewanella sp. WXL01]QBF82576.1 nitrate reductase cytochrome c-type subunit; periplasmic nitrate reductase electron transfer subunit [Shewanella maritima]
MKKIITLAAMMFAISACSGQHAEPNAAPVKVSSLAGDSQITDVRPADEMSVYPKRGKSIERTFVHQPPLIPHKDSYELSTKKNGCISCHSPAKAKRMKTTAVHESHLTNGELNGMYYFCDQCHVAQAENKQKIVDNTFSK